MPEEFNENDPITESNEKIISKPKGKKFWIALLIAVVIILLAGGVFAYWQANEASSKLQKQKEETKTAETKKDTTIVDNNGKVIYVNVQEGLRLRHDPDGAADVLATMPMATKLTVLAEKDDWYQVSFQDKTGWCMKIYTSAEQPKELSVRDVDFTKIIPFDSSVSSLSAPTYGDFNGDGKEEVLISLIFDGTGGIKEFYVYGYQAGYTLTKYLEVTKKAVPDAYVTGNQGHENMQFTNDRFVFSYPLYKQDDPNCCPTGGTEYVYFRWNGSKFVLDSKEQK